MSLAYENWLRLPNYNYLMNTLNKKKFLYTWLHKEVIIHTVKYQFISSLILYLYSSLENRFVYDKFFCHAVEEILSFFLLLHIYN